MSLVAAAVVVAFGLLLIGFTGVAFAKPAIAERFLMGFASSARTHFAEQSFRVVVGTALVGLSPGMWKPNVFWLVGWAIVLSSAALLCVPWQWHHRLGERVLPIVVRHLRLYAAGSFVFGDKQRAFCFVFEFASAKGIRVSGMSSYSIPLLQGAS